MTTSKRTRALLCTALALLLLPGAAPMAAGQETPIVQQDIEVIIDRLGNADLSARFTLPAAQWRMWKESYGENESLLKRDFQHQYSTVVLKDFRLERDDMNRTATLRMKGEADAEYRGDGVWEVELEKGLRGTRVSDTEWHFTRTAAEAGAVLQQNLVLRLPAGARNTAESTSELGVPILKYELRPERRSPLLPLAGGVLGLLGLAALALGARTRPAV
jgi:hypothetical protein